MRGGRELLRLAVAAGFTAIKLRNTLMPQSGTGIKPGAQAPGRFSISVVP